MITNPNPQQFWRWSPAGRLATDLRIFDRGPWWILSNAGSGSIISFQIHLRARGVLLAHVNPDRRTLAMALVWDGRPYSGDRVTLQQLYSILRRC